MLADRLLACAILLVPAACTTLPRADFSAQEQRIAEIPGFEGIRTWGDGVPDDFQRNDFTLPRPSARTAHYLALSSGGAGGAFGAGVLAGWTAKGTRPTFDLVSGVSTGALIAPFAFLGSDYDQQLSDIYTSGAASSVFRNKLLALGLLSSGLLQAEPLRRLIESYASEKLLAAVAQEHRKGRRLLVATTNMDAQRPVVWDMGKIAASGRPGALKLFRDVLVASASIPAEFPPVLIDVQAAGRRIQEMHADGGTSLQVFIVPEGLLAKASSFRPRQGTRANLYIVINNALMPEFDVTSDNTFAIGGRGLETMIKFQTRGSVNAIYAFAKQAGIDFNVASIDRTVPYDAIDPFNVDYTRTLFKLGHDQALSGYVWRAAPVFVDRSVSQSPSGYRAFANPAVKAANEGL
jgi:hypothetical protein